MMSEPSMHNDLLARLKMLATPQGVKIYWHVRVRPRVWRPLTFGLQNSRYRYYYLGWWGVWNTERAVEIPLALDMLGSAPPGTRVLEVGDVMTQYADRLPANYTVVDKYEQRDGVIKADAVSYSGGPFDLIISISTLEHVGLDEDPREWRKARDAISHVRSLLAPGGRMFATWPLRYNRDLDDALLDNGLDAASVGYLKRRTRSNKWIQVSASEAHATNYGSPYICGNAIAVVEWFAP
jgi:hypothetical protein